MASMEIGIRLPDVARRTAEVREYAKAYRDLGAAEKEFAGKQKEVNRVKKEEADIARMAKVVMRSEGVVVGARRAIENRNASEAQRVDRMIQRSAIIGDSLMARAQGLREDKEGGGGGAGPFSNLFGRRQRLIGPGGFNTFAIVARAGSMLEKINPAAAIAVGALVAFGAAVEEGTKRARELGDATAMSGGTMREVGQLGAAGIAPGEIAGRAAALRSRLSSDPFAMMASAGGGPQLPPQFGSQNFAATYLRALEGLRKITNAEEQLRQARWLGLEADLPLIRASERLWRQSKAIAAAEELIFTPRFVQDARDFGVAQTQVGVAFKDLGAAFAKPWASGGAEGMTRTADIIEGTAIAISKAGDAFGAFRGALAGDWLEKIFPNVAKWLHTPFGGDNTGATEDNTQAIKDLTYMLKPGVYGGGARARSALPSEMVGPFLGEALRSGAIRFGAF